MFGFSVDAFSLGAAGRFGGPAPFLNYCRTDDQLPQAFQSLLSVLLLTAALLRFDDDDAFPGEAAVSESQQPLFVKFRQGRCLDIKAQMNGRRDLVDILSAGAARANCADLNFMIRDTDLTGYAQHGDRPDGESNILPLLLKMESSVWRMPINYTQSDNMHQLITWILEE